MLFDLLRFVLDKCGIETSPEELLAQIFDANRLKAEIGDIRKKLENSRVFKKLPEMVQTIVLSILKSAENTMPELVAIVAGRIAKWKRLQHKSSAAAPAGGKSKGAQPGAKDPSVSVDGKNNDTKVSNGKSVSTQLATQAVPEITNELLGVSGEHIADYICARDKRFGWGMDWNGHDMGDTGKWLRGKPGRNVFGKLSQGGDLFKLIDGPNGTGIDSVWRAHNETNGGKQYAIVEAKASRDEDAPKFFRKLNNTRKPSIGGKLGVSGRPDPFELTEPMEEDTPQESSPRSNKVGGKQKSKTNSGSKTKTPKDTKSANSAQAGGPLVQMSEQWIEKNLKKAVGKALAKEIIMIGYSRQLFYSPKYHPCAATHIEARLSSAPDSAHANHDAFHYKDSEVIAAVNKRKKSLRKKYGNLPNLKDDK